MDTLVTSMVKENPKERPTMDQVVSLFEELLSKLPRWRLRWRLVQRRDNWFINVAKDLHHAAYRVPSQIFLQQALRNDPKLP